MATLTEATQRLELNQSSRIGTLEQLSGGKLVLSQGLGARIECALFRDTPESSSFITNVSDLDSANIVVRKGSPNGDILFTRDAVISTISYSSWVANTATQILFQLEEVDTTQIVPPSGRLPIYFVVTVVTNDNVPYIAGFGYGEIVDVGYIENPVSSDYITGRTNIVGGKLLTDFDLNGRHIVDSAVGGYIEEGSMALSSGSTEIDVSFVVTKPDADGYRFEFLYVKDAPTPIEPYEGIVVLKRQITTGFSIHLTQGAPLGSILYWKTIPKYDIVVPIPELRYGPIPAIGDPVKYQIWDRGGAQYNVLAYDGIFGDGVTDCTEALQTLVDLVYANDGGVIFFPPGDYCITGIVVIGDNITFEGCGFSSRIKNTSTSSHTFQFGSVDGGANYGQVINLRFHPTVTRATNAYEIYVHSANDTVFDKLTFFNIWGGIKLGRVDAAYGNSKISNMSAPSGYHQFLYIVRFTNAQCDKFVLGANNTDAISIILEGRAEGCSFSHIEATNGAAINVYLRAVDYTGGPPLDITFVQCNFDSALCGVRQDNGDHITFVSCWGKKFLLNGGANSKYIGCTAYAVTGEAWNIVGGSAIEIVSCTVRNCSSAGVYISDNFTGGVDILGGTLKESVVGLYIGSGVQNVRTTAVKYIDNTTDVNNHSTDSSVIIEGSSWSTYSPTITSSIGTITTLGTVTGRYKQIGKTVFVRITVNITTNGTASGYIKATLPVTAASGFLYGLNGQENALNGKMLQGTIDPAVSSTLAAIVFYDNTYPGANGCKLFVSGVYEAN